jgi:hypothetical protein
LGLHPGPEIGRAAPASLAGTAGPDLTRPLAELTRANLLAEPKPGRYGCHDLLRAFRARAGRLRMSPPPSWPRPGSAWRRTILRRPGRRRCGWAPRGRFAPPPLPDGVRPEEFEDPTPRWPGSPGSTRRWCALPARAARRRAGLLPHRPSRPARPLERLGGDPGSGAVRARERGDPALEALAHRGSPVRSSVPGDTWRRTTGWHSRTGAARSGRRRRRPGPPARQPERPAHPAGAPRRGGRARAGRARALPGAR